MQAPNLQNTKTKFNPNSKKRHNMLIKETNISWSLKRHKTHIKKQKKNNNFIFIKNQASSREKERERNEREGEKEWHYQQ